LRSAEQHDERDFDNMEPTLAWLAQGKVRIKLPGEPARTVESRFGQSIRDRVIRSQQRHAWKMGGDGKNFSRT
jgi:hypothetical protein